VPPRVGRSRGRGPSACATPRRLEEELRAEQAANEAYEAYRARGAGRTGRRFSPAATPKPYALPATPQGKVNITDLDSNLVKGMRGWVQGYNAQAVCNDQHLIIAAEVMTASPDFGHLGPMLTAARRELTAAGVTQSPEVVVADSGYWHLEQMNEITADGIPVLIPPDSSRRANKPRRPGWNGGAYAFMRSLLCTEVGERFYRQRAQLIEPIFWQHQAQPRLHQIPPTRPLRRPDRMVTHGRQPQPLQTAPALHRPRQLTTDRAAARPCSARHRPLRDSLTRKRQSSEVPRLLDVGTFPAGQEPRGKQEVSSHATTETTPLGQRIVRAHLEPIDLITCLSLCAVRAQQPPERFRVFTPAR
jgi:hypothetical protein